jgi:hypothetical protein
MENHRCRAPGPAVGERVVIGTATVYDDIVGRDSAQPAGVTPFGGVQGY